MMRTFRCYDCKHIWELPYGEGGKGTDLVCPECGSHNIHRMAEEHYPIGRRGKHGLGQSPGKGQGWGRGWRNRREPQDDGPQIKEIEHIDENSHSLSGMKIGILGKGGSGKSTVTALLAQALRERGYEVAILDADSTNVGLHQALGIDRAPAPLIDYFGGAVFRGGQVTCPVDDPTPLPNPVLRWDTLPETYQARTSSGIHYLIAGKIGDQGPGAGCDGPVAKIARDATIAGASDRIVTLVDFKAGFEDSARGAITSLNWIIVVIDPTNAAIQMAADVQHMITQIQAGELPATKHLESPEMVALANALFRNASIQGGVLVLNRVTNQQMEDYLRSALAERGLRVSGVIHTDPAITTAWLTGSKIESEPAHLEIQPVVEELERVAAHGD